jgi:glycogen debranching enzyme
VSTTIYRNKAFELMTDEFREDGKKALVIDGAVLETADGRRIGTTVSGAFPRLSSACPMLDAMYGVAIHDHELVTIDPKTYFYMLCSRFFRDSKIPEGMIPEGSVFWAGYGFNTYLYTRDTAYSSWLGTAYILPDVVTSHLKYMRKQGRTVGLKVAKLHEIPIEGIPTEQTGMTVQEMVQIYNNTCYTRRTDDIVWVLGLWEVYRCTRNESLLSYILNEFAYCDEHFYRYFLDQKTGLYRGQSTFIDIAGAPYGGRNASNTVILKTLSTNCLYAGCFELLNKAASLLGQTNLANKLQKRRDDLAESIRKQFSAVNYQHYLDDEGGSSGRQEVLGLAFLTLFNILPSEEGAKLLANYHDGDYGRPLMWPFCGSDRVYHDNSTWPFANTIFALAEYKAGKKQDVIRKTMGGLCRHSLNGNFNEVIEWKTGKFVGCGSYIWSAASYLALVYRMIAGMEVSETGTVSFAPVLPPELGDRLDLTGLKVGGMTINLHIRGNGEIIESCKIDGKECEQAVLKVETGERKVEVQLTG